MPTIDICMAPCLHPYHKNPNAIAVAIDIIRATTSMITAFDYGAKEIMPLDNKEDAFKQRPNGFLLAGEREALKIEGFDFGNSPYDFMTDAMQGAKLAFSTTNGTRTMNLVKDSKAVYIGSFHNFEILAEHLAKQNEDILLMCAGSDGKIALEDCIFAGKISKYLIDQGNFSSNADSVSTSVLLYENAKYDLLDYVVSNSRLKDKMHFLEKDITYCLSEKTLNLLPEYRNGLICI